ncbi:MAG: aminoacyl-histidine dipeptidase [Bacteroidia bacterium]
MEIRSLEPLAVWNYFADLNAVPRPSKKEERVTAFMKAFGESLGLETIVDEVGNVIIRKPATLGMENRQPVVLQGHLDMVHQKNASTQFDFDSQGIDMYVDGDWVRARGTTLGADNGMGVASIMAILASKEIAHPAVEALFTIDEETGMTGAMALQGGLLHGKIMLNLDTEDDRELTIGCAGGIDVTGTGKYATESGAGLVGYRLMISGLTGGHSGMDIHLGRGNANKLMNRLLLQGARQFGLRVHSIDGGSLRNAIPRESVAVVGVPSEKADAFRAFIDQEGRVLQSEYSTTDPSLKVSIDAANAPATVLAADFQRSLLAVTATCPNGIHRMSPDIPNLVQTSNNLARVLVAEGSYSIQCLTRSSVDSEKMDLALTITAAMELCGADVATAGSYPGWAPKPEADIVKIMTRLYGDRFGHQPHVNACHAGLECGILGQNYPGMEMISFGPNIVGAHSPDERVQVSSVQKFWGLLLETLREIPG